MCAVRVGCVRVGCACVLGMSVYVCRMCALVGGCEVCVRGVYLGGVCAVCVCRVCVQGVCA